VYEYIQDEGIPTNFIRHDDGLGEERKGGKKGRKESGNPWDYDHRAEFNSRRHRRSEEYEKTAVNQLITS